MTFLALFWNELWMQLRRPGTHVFALMYVAIGVLAMVAIGGRFESVQIGLGGGNIHVDSPWTIAAISITMSLFATMNIAAIAGGAACRDVEEGMHPLVYATPVGKWTFLGSRWLASLVLCGWLVAAIPVGLLFGALLPVVEPERIGSWDLASLFQTWIGWLLPNLVFTSALFFGLAALTRRMFPNYIGGVLLLVGYLGSSAITADLDNEVLAAMIDPFGPGAFEYQTRYSSPFEKNNDAVWPIGVALANRVSWLAVGVGMLVGGIGLARLDQDGWQLSRWLRRRTVLSEPEEGRAVVEVPAVTRRFDGSARASQLWALMTRSLRDVLGHRYFWAFVGAAVLFQLLNSTVIGSLYGTETWPVTYQVIEVLEGTLGVFLLVVLTFYAGDLVWHDRDLGTAPLYDSLPIPDVLPLLAKAVALFAVIVGMHVTVLVMGVGVQLFDGYTNLELGLYLRWLFGLSLIDWLPYVAVALAVHVIVDQKVVGHLLLVGFYVAQGFRGQLGFEYNLPWFGADPGRIYSDMNGWGWFLGPFVVYKLYWIAVGVGLLGIAALLWVRGADRGWRNRLVEARRRLDRPTIAVLAGSAVVAGGFAAFIGVQTSVVGTYRSTVDVTRGLVDYERRFQADWDGEPHPRITDVALVVDLYPSTGEAHATGTLTLENREAVPVAKLLLGVDPDVEVVSLTLDRPLASEVLDPSLPLRVWTLAQPMAPGERAELRFEVHRPHVGFPNQGANTTVVGNGTFVSSNLLIPELGYERAVEVADKAQRRKYALPERPRMRDLDDPSARGRNYLTDDGDRVQLDAIVRTDRGQIALAPGALIAQRDEGERAVFHYRTNRPILHFYSFLSAEYEVVRDRWEAVAIEVYFHPAHRYNVDRMIVAAKASLATFSEVYGPFQHDEIRIVEFPRYAMFAQSFPSTIPYSESIGFIARIADPEEDVDYPFYVTAHEVAHQWWAHQVIGADAQGSTVLSETLSQYSALIVMEREYGEDFIHRFLRYEADRYFTGRAFERDRELPLLRVEDQGYVHYNKGAVVMWALRERVGEERLNASIRTFLEQWRFAGPPYPTSRDLLTQLTLDLPDAADLLRDSFERIVFYENAAESATVVANADGTFTVKLAVKLSKTEADDVGDETDVPFSEPVQIGVFAGTEDAREELYLASQVLEGPTATVEVVVDREPTLAGVDPNHLLLDRDRDDNVVDVVSE